jgi:hypothetical protein
MSGALKQVQHRLEDPGRRFAFGGLCTCFSHTKMWLFGSARVEPPKAESANSSRGARLPMIEQPL